MSDKRVFYTEEQKATLVKEVGNSNLAVIISKGLNIKSKNFS